MSKELTKLDQRELHGLAKSINDREDVILDLRKKTEEACHATVSHAIEQGHDLISAKKRIPHGLWLDWLKSNCPRVKERQAQVYMKVADAAGKSQIRTGADSIKHALRMISEPEEKESGPHTAIPDYLRSLSLCAAWTKYVALHPIESCPEDTRDEMRKELQPIAARLWPEKFN